MTAPVGPGRSTVTLTAPCPTCGSTATWYGARSEPGGATRYARIDCPRCDGAVLEAPTVTADPEPPVVVPERVTVLRQLQARLGWA